MVAVAKLLLKIVLSHNCFKTIFLYMHNGTYLKPYFKYDINYNF